METSIPSPSAPVTVPTVDTTPPKSKTKKVLTVLGILFLIGAGAIGYLLYQGYKDGPVVSTTISSFMQMVSSGDLTNAYALTSAEFRKSVPEEEFAPAMDTFKAQYTGFQSQKQTGFSVEAKAGQPTIYKYSGAITYDNGDRGEIQAALVKEDKQWKIYGIKVDITLKRMQKFQQSTKDSVLGVSTSVE